MPDFKKLDDARRLTPWNDSKHADFVVGHYGSILTDEAAAERYVQEYEAKEKAFDLAYEEQRQQLREASKRAGDSPQELPDPIKINWNPRTRFAKAVKATVKPGEEKPKTTPVKVKVKPV